MKLEFTNNAKQPWSSAGKNMCVGSSVTSMAGIAHIAITFLADTI